MHSFFKTRTLRNKFGLSSNVTKDLTPSLNSSSQPTTALDELGRSNGSLQSFITPPRPRLESAVSQTSSTNDYQLIYGYIGLDTDIELDLPTTAQTIESVVHQLKSTALETPLLFSTHALDISTEGSHSLIKSFVQNQQDFIHDLPIHSPHNLSAFLKWVLSRYVNSQGTHGFLTWKKYSSWRDAEQAAGYPPRFLTTHLTTQMSMPAASLLTCLLDLFASASVRADVNGMTAHKCGALFGAYIFGLDDDQPFEQTYSQWLRHSHATEHLILAYMRDLKEQSPTGKLPLRMENHIKGYPAVIPPLHKTHPSARLERVARFRRSVPLCSKNLIMSAGGWNVARSKTWDRLKPYPEISAAQYLNRTKAGFAPDSSKLLLSPSYKHLLNIQANTDLDDSETDDLGANFEGPQRFKTLVEKEWSGFMTRGFTEPDAKKLEFNLDESSRAKLRIKHGTMDWDSFIGIGFNGRESYDPTDLNFSSDIQKTAELTPPDSSLSAKRGITKKLTKASRSSSIFPHDTSPAEQPSILVDENFFESWADVLVGSGWCRDEMKEVGWALLHCKCKPSNYQDFEFRPTPLNPDGRNDDIWVLFEEVVPHEYFVTQLNVNKPTGSRTGGRSFLRAITRKESKKKMTFISQVPSSYYSNASQQQPTFPFASQPGSHHLLPHSFSSPSHFRSLAKKLQGPINPHITPASMHHPVRFHSHDFDTKSVHEYNLPYDGQHHENQSEKWVNITFSHGSPQTLLRSARSAENVRSASASFDAPRPSLSQSGDIRSDSPHVSSDHDDNSSSAISRSIASSSDFTVELVERYSKQSAALRRPSSLVQMKSIPSPNLNLPKSEPAIVETKQYYIPITPNLSNELLTPRVS